MLFAVALQLIEKLSLKNHFQMGRGYMRRWWQHLPIEAWMPTYAVQAVNTMMFQVVWAIAEGRGAAAATARYLEAKAHPALPEPAHMAGAIDTSIAVPVTA